MHQKIARTVIVHNNFYLSAHLALYPDNRVGRQAAHPTR